MSLRSVTATFYVMLIRTWKKTMRRPIVLVFSFVQPLMWMFFFGFLFHRYLLEATPDVTYLQFLLPGVCGMTVLFGASQSGVGLIRDMQGGFLERILHTPAPGACLLAGKLVADTTRLLVQAFVVCLLGVALGARISPGLYSLLPAIAYLALFVVAYSSLSCWIALKTRSQETLGVFIQAFNMPVFFTSTALVPARQMPDWLAGIAYWNPLSSVVDVLRGALLSGKSDINAFPAALLIVIAFMLFIGAWKALERNRHGRFFRKRRGTHPS